MPLFHASPTRLAVGSIIEPGNWGRILRWQQMASGNVFQSYLMQETVLELVRVREFPQRVSRMEAVFAFENEGQAHLFVGGRPDLVYEVELVDTQASVDRLDHNLPVTWPIVGAPVLAGLEAIARQYWSGATSSAVELLSLSPLRIVSQRF